MTPTFISHAPPLSRRTTFSSTPFSKRPHIAPVAPRCIPARLPARCTLPLPVAPAWGIWAVLLSAAAGGLASNRTKLGAALSPPLVTTLATLALANFGALPPAHPAYAAAQRVLVPLAVPMLLFSADLRRVARDTGRLFPAFIAGAFSTAVATVVALRLVPLAPALGPDGWKIAAALCARHIGGAVNYVSATDALTASPASITAALAADNVVLSGYFMFLFALARGVRDPALERMEEKRAEEKLKADEIDAPWADQVVLDSDVEDEDDVGVKISMEHVGISLAISACMCSLGTWLSTYVPFQLGVIPVITLVALFASTVFPRVFGRFATAGNAIGIFFMQIFFAATGASGSIGGVLKSAPMLFVFVVVQLVIHVAMLFSIGRGVLKLHPAELLIASNANVGGPSTAAAMAAAKDWKSLVVPALLIGVFGYAIATFVALGVGHRLLKPMW